MAAGGKWQRGTKVKNDKAILGTGVMGNCGERRDKEGRGWGSKGK